MVDRPERAVAQFRPQTLVARQEEEVVVDAELQPARLRKVDELLALPRAEAHRLLDEGALARLEDPARDVDVQVRRQQHMDDVAIRRQQFRDVGVDQRHVECGGRLGRAFPRDVADRADLDAVGGLQRLGMGLQDVAGTQQADLDATTTRRRNSALVFVAHVRPSVHLYSMMRKRPSARFQKNFTRPIPSATLPMTLKPAYNRASAALSPCLLR